MLDYDKYYGEKKKQREQGWKGTVLNWRVKESLAEMAAYD